jgi:hypothetical protein
MTEHGWPDHHDDHGFHDEQHDPLHDSSHEVDPDQQTAPLPDDDDHGYFDVHHEPDAAVDAPAHEDSAHEDVPSFHEADDLHSAAVETHEPVGADPDALPDYDATETTFPALVDVGPLPEPVDGFPWIDTGSLGLVDPAALHETTPDVVDPHELAEYAGTELPPGVDPWAALADSEDPATAALARWWSPDQPT